MTIIIPIEGLILYFMYITLILALQGRYYYNRFHRWASEIFYNLPELVKGVCVLVAQSYPTLQPHGL